MNQRSRTPLSVRLGLLPLLFLPLACSSGGGSSNNTPAPLTAADLTGRWAITTQVTTLTGSTPGFTVGQTSSFPVTITVNGSDVTIRSDDASTTVARLEGSRVRASSEGGVPPETTVSVTDFGIVARQISGTATLTLRTNGVVTGTVVERLTGTRTAAAAVSDFLANVQLANGANGTRQTGAPPAAGNGPTITAASQATVINGGASQVVINSDTGIDALLVYVSGVDGYFRIPLGAVQNLVNLVLSIGAAVPSDTFQLVYAGERNGQVGAAAPTTLIRRTVGTGRLQVSLSWDSVADLDLHVVEPGGAEVWFGGPTLPSGAQLDLDSNAVCTAGISNENVTWGSATPRAGEYIVRVENYDACTAAGSNYVVRINVAGRAPMVFNGTMSGAGTAGGIGAGREIARFTF